MPIPLKYVLETDEECPFKFSSPRGVLKVGQSLVQTISYSPEQAEVPVASALIKFGDEEERVMKMSAVSKYPYISVDHSRIEFGDVLVGKSDV